MEWARFRKVRTRAFLRNHDSPQRLRSPRELDLGTISLGSAFQYEAALGEICCI